MGTRTTPLSLYNSVYKMWLATPTAATATTTAAAAVGIQAGFTAAAGQSRHETHTE